MSTFADSSALVKLYADEAGHEEIRSVGVLVVSQLARVEVPAAIWRKQRLGDLDPSEAALLVAAFEADYFGADGDPLRFAVVTASAAVLDAAAQITGVQRLRPFDAVQLATARTAVTADPDCGTFLPLTRTSVAPRPLRASLSLRPRVEWGRDVHLPHSGWP